jgi:hypothetical protein
MEGNCVWVFAEVLVCEHEDAHTAGTAVPDIPAIIGMRVYVAVSGEDVETYVQFGIDGEEGRAVGHTADAIEDIVFHFFPGAKTEAVEEGNEIEAIDLVIEGR